jgi:hypothetical protein
MTPEARVKRILAEAVPADLSSWEKFEFIPSVRKQSGLSEKQENVLRGIERRIFNEEDED